MACPPSSSSGGASLSSATSLGAWSAVATFPKIRVKTSSGSDSFYDESKQTLLFSWEDNSKVSLSFRGKKSLSSDEPHPPVTYSTNRRSISMMRMRRREDRDPTSSQAFSSTPTQRKMTSVIQGIINRLAR